MGKYPIAKELGFFRYVKAPVYRLFLPIANFVLRLLPKGFDKKKVDVKKYKIGKNKFHVVKPKALKENNNPLIFYIHGGGFVFGTAPGHYQTEQDYALEHNALVVGIDYPLAPKNKYPYALNQCYDIYKYLLENEFNIDSNKIILAGDSAGGLLCLDLYLKIIDESYLKPKGLLLIYPVVDNLENTESMKKYDDTPCWNAKNNHKMWKYYLGEANYISPLLQIEKFSIDNLYIELTEFDCLHDEGYNLYEALKGKISNLVLNDTKGTFHGYDAKRSAKLVVESRNKQNKFIDEVFNN